MTHKYKITGMTCQNCENKVVKLLKTNHSISNIYIDRANDIAEINMDTHVDIKDLKDALSGTGYQISEIIDSGTSIDSQETKGYSYRPIYLIFGFVTISTLVIQFSSNGFNFNDWMRQFMAGFFLVFSFFKLIDIKGFAMSYSSYDIIAKKFPSYGLIYPFIEFAIGIGFLIPQLHLITSIIALIVMSVSIAGVIQSMLLKRSIQCACLGAVFKLPLSKVTLIEDGLMILMSITTLFILK